MDCVDAKPAAARGEEDRVLSEKKRLRDSLGGNSLTVRVHGAAVREEDPERGAGEPAGEPHGGGSADQRAARAAAVPEHPAPQHAVKSRQSYRRLR